MPNICPVCSKKSYPYQSGIQCDSCKKWVHHGNRLLCSGLTDVEFSEHLSDEYKPFECEHCVSKRIADENKSIFVRLSFSIECEDNVFGKPEPKRKPDITSMSPDQLKTFVKQCQIINNQLNTDDDERDEFFSSMVNSNYYDIKKFNSLKPDIKSCFGLMHVNIASLDAHIDDLKTVLSRLKFDFDIIGISEHKI